MYANQYQPTFMTETLKTQMDKQYSDRIGHPTGHLAIASQVESKRLSSPIMRFWRGTTQDLSKLLRKS